MSTGKYYEFDESQNKTIETLGKTLRFVGVVSFAFALFFAAQLIYRVVQAEWSGMVSLVMVMIFALSMASLTFNSGREFLAIVDTTGQDISHLMKALDNLRQMYSILSVIVIICIVLTLVALVISFMNVEGPTLV